MDIGIERAVTNSKKGFSRFGRRVIFIFLIFCFIVLLILWRVQFKYSYKIINGNDLTPPNIGLVFGAGLKAKGVPGAVLEDRILTAIKLYQDGKIGKFIFSGDNSTAGHNEVKAMKNLAIELGLPEDAILEDHAGLSTRESCLHVKENFGLSEIILITQKYHLRRALYTCNELGIDAEGVAAENRGYPNQWKYSLRELGASVAAWLKIKG